MCEIKDKKAQKFKKMSLLLLFFKFFKNKTEKRMTKQVLSGGLVPVGGGRLEGKGVEYGANVMYICM
jgi:hypothetical protein